MRLLRVAMGAVVLAATAAGCGGDNQDEVDLALTRPGPRVTVEGNVVDLDLTASNIAIVKADGNRTGRSAHFHVFVDKEPVEPGEVIPVAPDIIHTADDPVRVSGLTPGTHTLTVVLGDGTHRRIGDHAVTTDVTVRGAAVTVTADDFTPLGQPVTLQLAAEGVTIAAPNGDTSGATGHFHVFVDKAPARPGDAIPRGDPQIIHAATTTVEVPDLKAGEHVFWVVLGDGNHNAFRPAVMATTKVTVGS